MPEQFLHGIEIVEIEDGIRTIRTVKTSVIGLVGTAPDADPVLFPANQPVLVAGSRLEAAGLDTTGDGLGTLPDAIDGIFDQAGAMVVVIRVEEGADDAETLTNLIGGVDADTGAYTGVHALVAARDALGLTPRILIVPGHTRTLAVMTELLPLAEQLKAVIIADGPDTNDADAITYRGEFGSARVFLVDPWLKVLRAGAEAVVPPSPRVAGLIAKSDNDRGFWWSPSNQVINGIIGTSRGVSWAFGDPNTRANNLNENEVATVIHQDGYRLWGNRTTSEDPKWAFLSVRRTADMLNESLMLNHLWAVDRSITRTYLHEVSEGVNAYLRRLQAQGGIIGGKCIPSPDLNTPEATADGKVFFDFDFTPPYPAEHITFRSHLVTDYLTEVA